MPKQNRAAFNIPIRAAHGTRGKGFTMDANKRKLYQARGHLLRAEAILKELYQADVNPVTRPHLERARFSVTVAGRRVYDYIFARYGSIKNLEAYK